MLCRRGLCRHRCPSGRPSVTFVDSVDTNKHIFQIFSPPGSHTNLVSSYQTSWQYCDEGVECRWGRQNRDFRPASGFIACCKRCDRQVLSITQHTTDAIELVQSTDESSSAVHHCLQPTQLILRCSRQYTVGWFV